MVKKNLILILILFLGLSCKISSVFPEESNDSLEIQKVINNYLDGFANQDANYSMEQISPNYYNIRDGEIFDYEKMKSIQEDNINKFYKSHTNYRHSDVNISNLVVDGDKATLDLEFKWRALNLNTSEEEESAERRMVALAKEGNSWKIIKIRTVEAGVN